MQTLKWTAEDFAGSTTRARCRWASLQVEWSYGDVEAGFKNAALVLDETFFANNQHHVLEPRTAPLLAERQLYMHSGTQSAVQTVASISRWLRLEPKDVVLITGTRAAASAAAPPARCTA